MDSKLGDIPKKDPKKLILDEFRSGKRIFESYNNFCKKMGSNFLDYPEFEFWFQRFSSGNFDLDYDRSQDPKYRTIEDIPVDIFEKICGNLKDDEKNNYWFTLRHVCKSFRAIVDSWTPPKFNNIEIYSYREQLISLRFNGFDISYVEKSEHLSEIGFSYHPNSLQSGNYRDLAIDDLTKILDVPGGCKLEKLKITEEIDNHFAQKLFEKIENCSKIHVGIVYLHIFRMEMIPVINILNLCQSIKEIDIQTSDLPNEEFTDKLKEITSLKNVEMVKIHNTSRDGEFWDPSSLNVPIITVVLTKTTVYKFIRLLKVSMLRNAAKIFELGANFLAHRVRKMAPNSKL
ncbi:hypothetical protein B9Z55_026871 [Caenorhabditis nigoni]|uniref:Mos1 transposase HTH domain-containing protein n=1 Tax=Caenorhabditis nigoni TaxID=1611254 RepID=A0A2G5SHT2_9PELO|nr:hypothetical protein B9Z55_026871 [Caenorhabditis nigoni]